MARGTLETIRRLDPPFSIDPDWEQVGTTPKGSQLWRETTKRSRSRPDIDETTGQQRMQLHPTTAKPLYPLRKPEIYDHVRTFYLVSEGNGNITKVDWHKQTSEEAAAASRSDAIDALTPALSAEMVDAGITPSEMAEALRMVIRAEQEAKEASVKAVEPEPEAEPVAAAVPVTDPVPQVVHGPMIPPAAQAPPVAEAREVSPVIPPETFPFQYAPGRWRLSNGNQINTMDQQVATDAEAALQEGNPSG